MSVPSNIVVRIANARLYGVGSVARASQYAQHLHSRERSRPATEPARPRQSGQHDEVAAADEHGMAMVFTGMRHFRH